MEKRSLEKFRSARIDVTNDVLSYDGGQSQKVGCFLMSIPLNEEMEYFELEILSTGVSGRITIGLAPYDYPLDCQPGWKYGSVAYHADDGRLFKCTGAGTPFGPRCKVGDRMGCGVRAVEQDDGFNHDLLMALPITSVEVYFTRNGEEVGTTTMLLSENGGGLHPAVGMHSGGESVKLCVLPEDLWKNPSVGDDFMLVDGTEEDWMKVHDVKINGQVIEYHGNGSNIHDVGLAQAKHPLTTTNHYFEIEILEPGQHCYIAIGLTHKNYPLHRHPGWNAGSVAYHADDGKIFLGKGQGTLFGPRSYRGDIIGCGVQFPLDYTTPSDGEEEVGEEPRPVEEGLYEFIRKYNDDGDEFHDANDILIDLLDDLDDHHEDDFGSMDEDDYVWPQGGRVPPAGVLPPAVLGREQRWFDDGIPPRHLRRGARLRGKPPVPHAALIYGPRGKGMLVKVFFTRNGQHIGHKEVMTPKGGFYPSIGMLSSDEKVRVDLRPMTG
ncbi:SPRY domain-containing protein 3-like [Ciona intestinalis]